MASNLIPNRPQLVIERKKVMNVNLGGQRFGKKDILGADITEQTQADIEWLLKAITVEDTEEQIKKGNYPTDFRVDNKAARPLHLAKKKTEVIFGELMQRSVLRLVEQTLASNIRQFTESSSLADIRGNWEWLLFQKDPESKSYTRINTPIPTKLLLSDGIRLVLKPKLRWASVVNRDVARRNMPLKRSLGRQLTRATEKGYMGMTANKLSRTRFAKNFKITVVFTGAGALGDELYAPKGTKRTACLVISKKNELRKKGSKFFPRQKGYRYKRGRV